MMQRTQILLDYKTKKDLKDLAASEGKSLSQIVRESLHQATKEAKNNKKKKISAVELFKRIAARAGYGPGDSEYDKYAYDL